MKYIISPYLKLTAQNGQNNKYKIINYLILRPQIITKEQMHALLYCTAPQSPQDIVSKFGETLFQGLVETKQLLEANNPWTYCFISHIEVETSTICNWKCEYCPVKYNRRTPKRMELALFKKILKQAQACKTVRYITLHSYNEPTIDKNFIPYLKEIAATDLKLVLYTNGSGLDAGKIQFLKTYPNLRNIIVTIPSADPERFRCKTGSNDYEATTAAIRSLLQAGLKVSLSVQGHGDEAHRAEIEQLVQMYPGIQCNHHISFDRAGLLTNSYNQQVQIDSARLYGCRSIMEILTVNVDGDAFLCCNDFKQAYRLGNVTKQSISDLLAGKAASRLRKKIWGGEDTKKDFICKKCFLMQLSEKDQPIYMQTDKHEGNEL